MVMFSSPKVSVISCQFKRERRKKYKDSVDEALMVSDLCFSLSRAYLCVIIGHQSEQQLLPRSLDAKNGPIHLPEISPQFHLDPLICFKWENCREQVQNSKDESDLNTD